MRAEMHTENLSNWIHDHVFHVSNEAAEKSTRIVMWITALMMVVGDCRRLVVQFDGAAGRWLA